MTRILNTLWVVFMSGMVGVAAWVAVTDVYGPNPAFVPSGPSHSTVSRPVGFNQAQGK
jgi:hypothetical protein